MNHRLKRAQIALEIRRERLRLARIILERLRGSPEAVAENAILAAESEVAVLALKTERAEVDVDELRMPHSPYATGPM